jgi:hypothetical protein
MSTTHQPVDPAAVAMSMLRDGRSTTAVRAALREQHGLNGTEAARVLKRAKMELQTPAEAAAVAEQQLRQGRPLVQVKLAMAERYGLEGAACRRVIDAAVASVVEDFETGPIDLYLEAATGALNDKSLTPAQRRKAETELEQVWQSYDVLVDPDATACETIAAALKIDRLLRLGWKARLPHGYRPHGGG